MKRRARPLYPRHKRRRFAPSRQRERPTGVSVTQWSQQRKRYSLAKRRTKINQAMRLIRSNQEVVRFVWSGMSNFDNNGWYWMGNQTFGTGITWQPCYVYDITAANVDAFNAVPFLQLQMGISGNVYFSPTTHNVNGINNTELRTEAYAFSTQILRAKALLDWSEIKLNCWGAKQKSIKYTIDVVQFKDDDICPIHTNSGADDFAYSTTAGGTKRTEWWQNYLKSYTYNPAAITGGMYNKRVKVLRHQEFILDPNLTIEEDSDPAVKNVRIFMKLDRVCDYREEAVGGATLTEAQQNEGNNVAVQTHSNLLRPYLKAERRIYLVIRASNFVHVNGDGAFSNNIVPSFDLRVRTQFKTIATA